MHESASDLHETLSANCPHRGQQSNKFLASTEFPLSNYKNKAKFIDDVISGDDVIFRNFKHILGTTEMVSTRHGVNQSFNVNGVTLSYSKNEHVKTGYEKA